MNGSFDLSDDDVVSMAAKDNPAKTTTSKIREIKNSLAYLLSEVGSWGWVNAGLDCSILSVMREGGWQKGRIRLKFEFIPDKPPTATTPRTESPLDDLRSELDLGKQ